VVNITTFWYTLDEQLLSVARQIVVSKFRRFEHAAVIVDDRLIEIPRIGTARQVAVVNAISNVVTSLKQIVHESHVLCKFEHRKKAKDGQWDCDGTVMELSVCNKYFCGGIVPRLLLFDAES